MNICLLVTSRIGTDARALALAEQLRRAGHRVTAVAVGPGNGRLPFPVMWIPPAVPAGSGPAARLLRRLIPPLVQQRLRDRRLITAIRRLDPEVIYPTAPALVPLAGAAAGDRAVVARPPSFPETERDLIMLAPSHPALAASGRKPGRLHVPHYPPPLLPAAGRHAGRRIVLCYQRTEANPGRYLEVALRRAGMTVTVETTTLDWATVPDDAAGVVFVESPLPAIEVTGSRKPVPTAFWVHHGEHHLATNLRLRGEYGADLVLLAHSWHLAHRFDVPVERFPFAVPTELFDGGRPWRERDVDVAFVGSLGGPYDRRRRILEALSGEFGDRVVVTDRATPRQMADLYGRACVVVNDGGTRHFPITMRVFEAIGAGALLVTDPAPGLDLILAGHYETLEEADPAAQVADLLSRPDTALRAEAALEFVLTRHTYDHRIDELLSVLGDVRPDVAPREKRRPEGLAGRVDIDVQRLLVWKAPDVIAALPDRECWDAETAGEKLLPGNFEAVVLGRDPGPDADRLLAAARRFVYAAVPAHRTVAAWLREHRPDAGVDVAEDVLRADLHAPAYRLGS